MTRRGAAWGLVLGLGLLARLAVVAPAASRPLDDPDNYLPLARSLADGRGFVLRGRPTAYRPPLYPLALAPLVAAFGPDPSRPILALHLGLGLATIGLVGVTARRWGLPTSRALVAATIVAVDPVLVVQSRAVMTETLAATLLAAALAALTVRGTRGAALGGIALGLAALCRPSTLPAAGLIGFAMVLMGPGRFIQRLQAAIILGLSVAVTLAPWAIRNARLFGEPVWTTTHGGYTLALANNPFYYAEVLDGPPGAVWSGPSQTAWQHANHAATDAMTEPAADRFLRARAIRLMIERPKQAARASLARLGRFWGLAPSGAVYPPKLRLAVAAWTVPFWIALAVGVLHREARRWPAVAAAAVILALTLVHTFYWTDLRMRAPAVPAMALIAALAGRRGK